jgi:hypothetical protein
MRIGRVITFAGIAAISGTIGFLIGGGRLPDSLRDTPGQIAAQAKATADDLQQDDTSLTGALNFVRDRVYDGAHQVTGLLDDAADW